LAIIDTPKSGRVVTRFSGLYARNHRSACWTNSHSWSSCSSVRNDGAHGYGIKKMFEALDKDQTRTEEVTLKQIYKICDRYCRAGYCEKRHEPSLGRGPGRYVCRITDLGKHFVIERLKLIDKARANSLDRNRKKRREARLMYQILL